jgi:hypothetical protein
MNEELPVIGFEHVAALRKWLQTNHATSNGVFVRIYRANSGVADVSFQDVLDEGL